jgi:hypothetical protein
MRDERWLEFCGSPRGDCKRPPALAIAVLWSGGKGGCEDEATAAWKLLALEGLFEGLGSRKLGISPVEGLSLDFDAVFDEVVGGTAATAA